MLSVYCLSNWTVQDILGWMDWKQWLATATSSTGLTFEPWYGNICIRTGTNQRPVISWLDGCIVASESSCSMCFFFNTACDSYSSHTQFVSHPCLAEWCSIFVALPSSGVTKPNCTQAKQIFFFIRHWTSFSWRFWPSQQHPSILLYPDHRLSNF